MTTNPTPTANDAKYEEMTKSASPEEVAKYVLGIEDAVARAWAEHTKTNKDEQGKNLGSALYDAANDFVRKDFFGNENYTNTRAKRVIDAAIMHGIGYSKAQLTDMYGEQKVVHLRETDQVRGKMGESLAGLLDQDLQIQLQLLGSKDFEAFRDYLVGLAKKVGLTDLTKDKMSRLSVAQELYTKIVLPKYKKYLSDQKDLERQNEAMKKLAV